MNSLKNYIKIYFRRFKRESSHYLVNTLGLMLGFTVLLFVLVYSYDEMKIDTFHEKADRIYRVVEKRVAEDGTYYHIAGSNPLAPALKREYPEIEEAAQMFYVGSAVFTYGDKQIANRNYFVTKKELFNIWDIEILQGDPKSEYESEEGLVLSRSFARSLFGDENPIGKVVENRFGKSPVLAVMEDFPGNSTYQPDIIVVAEFDRWHPNWQNFFNSWDSRFMMNWVLFEEGKSPGSVLAKKDEFLKKYFEEEAIKKHDFYFQNIRDVHLGSEYITKLGMEPLQEIPGSNRQFVWLIFIIGSCVILIASLNFINLSSVQALKRIKEAGIRKVNGATSKELRLQLFTETFISVLLSYLAAVALVAILLPYFNMLSNKTIELQYFFTGDLILIQLIAFLATWLLSSLIPAVYYSRGESLILAKNVFAGKGERLRKGFVVVQYAISMGLIVSVFVFHNQMNYIQNKDLGFTKSNLLVLDINSGNARSSFKGILQGLRSYTGIVQATASSRVPGEWKDIPEADLKLDRTAEGITASHYAFDYRGLETFSINLTQGENFSGNDARDSLKVILNETAVKMLGLTDPVGKSIYVHEDTISRMQVIGVVEDFHFESLYEPIKPVLITSWNNPVRVIDYFAIKYSGNEQEVLAHAEKVNKQFDPGTPPEFNFLDERWERYYQADQTRSNLFMISAILSIIISIIGLFGMINYTVERRTKEMGIRKVMGASIPNIIRLVLKDYLVLLLIAMIIAAPIAWWMLRDWLNSFAYRVDLNVGIFILSFLIILSTSFITVIHRVYRMARANPVNALRYE